MNAMKDKALPGMRYNPLVFLAPLGDAARKKAFPLFEDLRKAGIRSSQCFGKAALKAQLEMADRSKVRYTLILGQKEVLDGTIIIRDMESGAQETVDGAKVVGILLKKIAVNAA